MILLRIKLNQLTMCRAVFNPAGCFPDNDTSRDMPVWENIVTAGATEKNDVINFE